MYFHYYFSSSSLLKMYIIDHCYSIAVMMVIKLQLSSNAVHKMKYHHDGVHVHVKGI